MYINDYGEKDKPLVILLAPMMVSGTDLYELIHPYLKGEYHIIAPDQGGHGKAGGYVSADEEYRQLITLDWESYFTEQGIEVVHPGEAGAACTVDGKGC